MRPTPFSSPIANVKLREVSRLRYRVNRRGASVIGVFWRTFTADARHAQIAALTLLLSINLFAIDFGATPTNAACALGSCLIAQALASRWK